MRHALLLLGAMLTTAMASNGQNTKINNLKTFAQAYGYVKYFHPSDEASEIDWNSFAAYGAQQIEKCNSKSELANTLNRLFKPIAPSVVFSEEKLSFNKQSITPPKTKGYEQTYWQHSGVSKGMSNQNGAYRSVRVNRDSKVNESDRFANMAMWMDPEKYKGKEIKYSAWAKLKEGSKGTGHLWLRVDKSDKTIGFFDNMGANPITSNEWKRYEIEGSVDKDAARIVFGGLLSGKGSFYMDDVHISYKENNEWIEIPIENPGFEDGEISNKRKEGRWSGKNRGYTFKTTKTLKKEGNSSAVMSYEGQFTKQKGEALFGASPKFGECIEKEIGDGIFCQIPLSLYANDEGTYPKSTSLSSLVGNLEKVDDSPTNLYMRLGNVVNTYNVFQHFYPYFKEVSANWNNEFETALKRSFEDQTDIDHLITLERFTAPLKDGHIRVRGGRQELFVPPIYWEWIEDKLVITKVKGNNLNLKVGDVVTKVNDQSSEDFFKTFNARISAGTKGWLNYRFARMSLFGAKNSELLLEVNNQTISLKRTEKFANAKRNIAIQEHASKALEGNIMYLNLDAVSMDAISELMPQLEEAQGIICDLRGYPNGNHDLISHLLKEDDTSMAWMRVPQMIYPDQENIAGYRKSGWGLQTKKPHLGDKKVAFIIDGSAISYAESYMGFIKAYKLATIVGQPTAGANGNINPFRLLGGYGVSWTGMKVVKHDGSQHHAVGVLPDVYVDKTIEGLKAGKDEFLEKAIQVVSEE
jgi:C-terminal processing protease CtpA/Prc